MKIIIALAFLAVAYASVQIEPVVLAEPAVPYDETPASDLRVQVVELAEPDAAAEENPDAFVNSDGYLEIAPGELESLRVQMPLNYDPAYPYKPRLDPMLR